MPMKDETDIPDPLWVVGGATGVLLVALGLAAWAVSCWW